MGIICKQRMKVIFLQFLLCLLSFFGIVSFCSLISGLYNNFKTESDRKINWYSYNQVWKVYYLESFRTGCYLHLSLHFLFNLKVSYWCGLKGEVKSWLNTFLKCVGLRSSIVQGSLENLFFSHTKSCSFLWS